MQPNQPFFGLTTRSGFGARLFAAALRFGSEFRLGGVRLRRRIQHAPQHVIGVLRLVVHWLLARHPKKYSVLQLETKGAPVFRLSGAWLYSLSSDLRPLIALRNDATVGHAYGVVSDALKALEGLLGQGIIRLPASRAPANALVAQLRTTEKALMDRLTEKEGEWDKEVGFFQVYEVRSKAESFEPVLLAELTVSDLYVITAKGGFDLTLLAENGLMIFPSELSTKVPDAMSDAKQAARCIAFDLPTAAGFHLHRVNELVMHAYYDHITEGKPRPESRNIGAYIDAMKNHQVGNKVVFAALASLKDLHRNPVIHPEQHIDSIEDAIALHGSVCAAVGYMLKALPPPALELVALPGPRDLLPSENEKPAEAS